MVLETVLLGVFGVGGLLFAFVDYYVSKKKLGS
jgi:hypothetical protein